MSDGKRDNHYLIECSCGRLICTSCALYENRLAGLCGCAACDQAQRGMEKRHAKHIAEYDHSLLAGGSG